MRNTSKYRDRDRFQIEGSIKFKFPSIYCSTDHIRLKNLFEFKEGMHTANVERMRSILSVNLDTVSEVGSCCSLIG